jgi:SagB-type dehydrogenase family enzyme
VKSVEKNREFLKHVSQYIQIEDLRSDQQRGVPPPPLQKPVPKDAEVLDLVPPDKLSIALKPMIEVIDERRSHRSFLEESLSFEELSFLLWATQGVRSISKGSVHTLRTVPSAGARHPFETYLVVDRVEDIRPGLYRYLPLTHGLLFVSDTGPEFKNGLIDGVFGQEFVGGAALVFIWTVIPYRSEWRYLSRAHKVIAIDAGHVCQNLYLASEAIGAGVCAIAAYDQEKMDALLGVDGTEEFTFYLAPVGKVRQKEMARS